MNITIPEYVNNVLDRLHTNGFQAYTVGGCVRDSLLGKKAHDWDVTTDAVPNTVKALFSDHTVLQTGLKHGTVTVLVHGLAVEITTFRQECGYSDKRHPDAVRFSTTLAQDIGRRDFTMNAIAYAPSEGIVDLCGGIDDIKGQRIRCVGDPEKRFGEDALRILRAIRFAAVLGFTLTPETEQAARQQKDNLREISAERVLAELVKLLMGEYCENVLLRYPDILGVWLPEILPMVGFEQRNHHHIYDIWTHTAKVVAAAPRDEAIRLAALFHDAAKPTCFSMGEDQEGHFFGHAGQSAETANAVLHRLKTDHRTTLRVINMIKYHDTPTPPQKSLVLKRLNRWGNQTFSDVIALARADNLGQAPEFFLRKEEFSKLDALRLEILNEQACFSLKQLAVNGRDLLALGMQGREIGEKLNFLLQAVLNEEVENKRDALLTYLQYSGGVQ